MEILEKGNVKLGYLKTLITVQCTGKGQYIDKINADRKVLPCGALLSVGARDVFNICPNKKTGKSFRPAIKCPICGSLTCVDVVSMPARVKQFVENRTEEDVDNDPFRN